MAYDPNNLWNYGANSGAIPIIGSGGAITGYNYGSGNAGTNNSRNYGTNSGAIPVRGPNGAVAGYNYGNGATPTTTPADVQASILKKPTLNSQGQWVLPDTGLPAHGAYTDPATGQPSYYSNGKSVTNPGDIGIQTPTFTPTATAKPGMPTGDAIAKTADTVNAETNASFADYLAQAKALNAQGATQLTKDQAMIDPTATVARVNADTAKTTAALDATNRNYATQQQGVQDQLAKENVDYAAQVQQRLDALAAENTTYEQKAQAVADQAFNSAKAGISLYQMGSGTPTSGSGNLSNRYIRSYDAINVPLQQDLSQRRMGLIGEQQQADKQLYQNQLNQFSSQAALNTDLTNRDTDTTKYTGNLDTTTAQYIQQLMTQTAGMSRQMAAQYLQQLTVPFSIGQAILTGQIQNLAGIQAAYNGANWYSVSQPYTGSNVPATPGYPVQSPSRNYTPNGGGSQAGANGGDGSQAGGGANPTPSRTYSGTSNGAYLSGQSEAQLNSQGLTSIGQGQFYDMYSGNIYNATGQLIQQYDGGQAAAPIVANDYSTTPGGGGGYGGSGAGGSW